MTDDFDGTYLKILQERSILKGRFSELEIEDLARGMCLRRFCNDETLSRVGEPADATLILLEEGGPRRCAEAAPGDVAVGRSHW